MLNECYKKKTTTFSFKHKIPTSRYTFINQLLLNVKQSSWNSQTKLSENMDRNRQNSRIRSARTRALLATFRPKISQSFPDSFCPRLTPPCVCFCYQTSSPTGYFGCLRCKYHKTKQMNFYTLKIKPTEKNLLSIKLNQQMLRIYIFIRVAKFTTKNIVIF